VPEGPFHLDEPDIISETVPKSAIPGPRDEQNKRWHFRRPKDIQLYAEGFRNTGMSARRLATILDVVGYSRLVSADEAAINTLDHCAAARATGRACF
jgi:hypothetical protein